MSVLPQPRQAPHGVFAATVALQTLRSPLLPVLPWTMSVSAPGRAAVLLEPPGAVLLGPPSSIGRLRYQIDAPQPVTTAQLASLPGVAPDPATSVPFSTVQPYLRLPKLPARVVSLAHQIVADAPTPAAAVIALNDWFTSGSYRYTLNPPALHGRNPLTTFLFTTRAGFCQQFAGAFAVLARIDGLPTRIAVGFTPGQPVGDDTYLVSAIDAHVWPQVYLGPSAGWVSVDPTPGDGTGLGPTPGALSTGSPETGNGLQNVRNPQSANKATHTPAQNPAQAAAHRGGVFSGAAGRRDGILVAVVVGVAAGLAGGLVLLRRRTRRTRRRRPRVGGRRRPEGLAGTDAKVLHSWRRAANGLDHIGLGRRPTESPTEHARRLRLDVPSAESGLALGSYVDLAELAAQASYAPEPCTDADGARARSRADTVTAGARHAPRIRVGAMAGSADDGAG